MCVCVCARERIHSYLWLCGVARVKHAHPLCRRMCGARVRPRQHTDIRSLVRPTARIRLGSVGQPWRAEPQNAQPFGRMPAPTLQRCARNAASDKRGKLFALTNANLWLLAVRLVDASPPHHRRRRRRYLSVRVSASSSSTYCIWDTSPTALAELHLHRTASASHLPGGNQSERV